MNPHLVFLFDCKIFLFIQCSVHKESIICFYWTSKPCTVYNSVQCTVYSVQCTVYSKNRVLGQYGTFTWTKIRTDPVEKRGLYRRVDWGGGRRAYNGGPSTEPATFYIVGQGHIKLAMTFYGGGNIHLILWKYNF